MAAPITITIFEDPLAWLKENLPDLEPDRVCAIRRRSDINWDGHTEYVDIEESLTVHKTAEDHVKALQLLCEQIGWDYAGPGKGLYVGCIKNPRDLTYAANWNCEVVDAYLQLLVHGEVIYG